MTAREAALKALERCRRDGAWSNAAIDNVIKKYELDRRDAALASILCLGVLQNSSLLDFYIDSFSTTRADRLEPKVRDILRVGIYQLVSLDKIPARAAVNESVSLCKISGCGRAAGLVNAVLRKVSSNLDSLPEIPGKGTAKHLSVKHSHPEWIAQSIMDCKGYAFAEDFLRANNMPSGLNVQINTLKVEKGDYICALTRNDTEYTIPDYPENCVLLPGGSVTALPGYNEGLFYIQDRAACTAVQIMSLKPGMRVLDACSAPGGKSFAAAIAMGNQGSILSRDIHEKKLSLIRSGADRLGINIIQASSGDARKAEEKFTESFDAVIADVPCSGLGVIRKKPEIREKTHDEVRNLPDIQRDIIENLSAYVKPGGLLLYSTCTVLKAENEDIVTDFLNRHREFEAENFSFGDRCSENGMYTFWPNIDGTDGFFAAKLRKKKI